MWIRVFAAAWVLCAVPSMHADAPRAKTMTSAEALELTLDSLRRSETQDAANQIRLARQAIAALRERYPENIAVAEILAPLATSEDAAALRKGLWDIAGLLSFVPNQEAPLPEGFPGYSMLGEIVVKQYPAYRRATTQNWNETASFFTLFAHIQKENIAMTAPVEMNLNGGAKRNADAMSFLYRTKELGKTGAADVPGVKVVDMPAMTVVSVAMKDRPTAALVDRYEKAMRAWVQTHRPNDSAQLGAPRILGYNSPQSRKQYWDLQLPLLTNR
jgi:hypothetical protein